MDELEDSLSCLKDGKTRGMDGIRTEMLKHSSSNLKAAGIKLFNLALKSGVYPEIWIKGLITPTFKNGDCLLTQ